MVQAAEPWHRPNRTPRTWIRLELTTHRSSLIQREMRLRPVSQSSSERDTRCRSWFPLIRNFSLFPWVRSPVLLWAYDAYRP
jgi:hypothetical protein